MEKSRGRSKEERQKTIRRNKKRSSLERELPEAFPLLRYSPTPNISATPPLQDSPLDLRPFFSFFFFVPFSSFLPFLTSLFFSSPFLSVLRFWNFEYPINRKLVAVKEKIGEGVCSEKRDWEREERICHVLSPSPTLLSIYHFPRKATPISSAARARTLLIIVGDLEIQAWSGKSNISVFYVDEGWNEGWEFFLQIAKWKYLSHLWHFLIPNLMSHKCFTDF